ncbi:putative anthocyanidin 3-O-glucosyltransferase [Helianthus annuus]|uniref:Anthocyanidin 3-O-glucosyltransferase n=1 Tax=Helianthus annuus TaxID=4232 RepID=A0A9K3IKU2_HELAN|nr:putative anthocyanidin 3-O-glucosyltransferase [Helianthus annuus]
MLTRKSRWRYRLYTGPTGRGCRSMLNRDDENYAVYLSQAIGVTLADGMLINTWEDLEPQTLNALRTNEILRSVVKYKPVYTVGPVNKRYEPDGLKGEVVEWLVKQPDRSPTKICLGGAVTEWTCVRWIIFKPGQSDATRDYLPEGFLTRTQKVGLVVSSWAPQVEILNHTSVAGFLTHCGWNSTLESVTNGVPMIAWPLYAEQKMNAAMLTEELKVAVRPEVLPTKKSGREGGGC